MKNYAIALLLCLLSVHSMARDVKGVNIAESVTLGGETLGLNGAGVRSKFFISVYVGASYLPGKAMIFTRPC